MFRITDNKGFHLTFKNGVTISVQFGIGNYGDNYNLNQVSQTTYGDPMPHQEAQKSPHGIKTTTGIILTPMNLLAESQKATKPRMMCLRL